MTFATLWDIFVSFTEKEYQKEILLREANEECLSHFYLTPNLKCYHYPPFNILHIMLIFRDDGENYKINFEIDLYENYFNKTELREIISKSNEFLPYFFQWMVRYDESDYFVQFLKKIFDGEKKMLKEFILRKIMPANLSIFKLIENIYDHDRILEPFNNMSIV